jgi:hypothetical protein
VLFSTHSLGDLICAFCVCAEKEEANGGARRRRRPPGADVYRPSLPAPPPPSITFEQYFAPPSHLIPSSPAKSAPSPSASASASASAAAAAAAESSTPLTSSQLYAFHLGRPVNVKEELKSYTATVGMCHTFPLSIGQARAVLGCAVLGWAVLWSSAAVTS